MTEHRGNDQRGDGQCQQDGIAAGIPFVEFLYTVAGSAGRHGKAEDEQQVADDRTGDGGLDQFEQTGLHGGNGDDQLRGVTERGIEQGAQARVGMGGQVFGGFTDQRGKRNDAQRGEGKDRNRRPAKQLGSQR